MGELGYYTHYQDQNMDLLQLGVRFYDPEIGRFTQGDAASTMTESTYVYCGNAPTWWVDPSGFTRTNVNNDAALKKCRDTLRECVDWAGDVIDQVKDRWFTDDSDPKADMWVDWIADMENWDGKWACLARGVPPRSLPRVNFNPCNASPDE